MDWKAYYRAELECSGARNRIEGWLAHARPVDRITTEGVLSFPHTALGFSGPSIARVARTLLETRGVERVLALGVLHGGALEPYRRALDVDASAGQRAAGFAAVRGAFLVGGGEMGTPFGPVAAWHPDSSGAARTDGGSLLAAEFSLDTFGAVLRVASDMAGRRPLPVCALFVGMTRDPISGSFTTAEEIGDWLRVTVDGVTAVVATGDLVHYGTGYGEAWIAGSPMSAAALAEVLRPEVLRVLRTAFVERDWEAAYRLSRNQLHNDQREMLAVLSSYLGPGVTPELLEFDLSDYSQILSVAPPCVVASALAAYRRSLRAR